MTRLISVTAALTLFVLGAPAQDGTVIHKTMISSNVMGKVVKGAPYSAEEITESLQVLADGTRISNQRQVTVYRDGEGRVRRESPTEITIFDPVANVSYSLNPKTMTGVKSSMGASIYSFIQAPGQAKFYFGGNGPTPSPDLSAAKADLDTKTQLMAASLDKLKAELAASESGTVLVNGNPATGAAAVAMKEQLSVAMEKLAKTARETAKAEALGQQVMQGLTADGTRNTATIEVGAIGNDRPIQVVSERWYSAELQTPVMTKRTDPRSGEESFRLTNVQRGEPGADLFLLPPGYQLAPTVMPSTNRKEE
jgi:hypothetical protein